MAIVTRVKARSRSSASLLFNIVRAFLSYLDDQGLIEGFTLPRASRVAPKPEPRTRTPSDALLAQIWQACDHLTPRSSALLRLVLLTGQRRRSIERARWRDIDLDRGVLRIPSEHMKSRKPHAVTLGPLAIAQVRNLPRHGEYIFGGLKPPHRLNDAIKKVREITGRTWAPHDFRRCAMTWAIGQGYPKDDVKALLGHVVVQGVDRSYDHHDRAPGAARVALAWQQHIAVLIGAPRGAQVVSLRVG